MVTIIDGRPVRMHNPAHPGEILREMYLEPLGVNVTQAAEALDVSRKHLSAVLNARASVTPDMAIRLEGALKADAEFWLNLQTQYDLWAESRKAKPRVKPLTAMA